MRHADYTRNTRDCSTGRNEFRPGPKRSIGSIPNERGEISDVSGLALPIRRAQNLFEEFAGGVAGQLAQYVDAAWALVGCQAFAGERDQLVRVDRFVRLGRDVLGGGEFEACVAVTGTCQKLDQRFQAWL
jgi:hypothetical protein